MERNVANGWGLNPRRIVLNTSTNYVLAPAHMRNLDTMW